MFYFCSILLFHLFFGTLWGGDCSLERLFLPMFAILGIMLRPVIDLIKRSFRRRDGRAEVPSLGKIDNELTENMRALRLTATMLEQLLSRGMAASDAVHLGLGITSTYCALRVHIDISNTILTLSQDRGIDREPLTIIRVVTPRRSDYHKIQQLQELGRSIRSGELSLEDAEHLLDEIITQRRLYPWMVSHLAAGGVSAGVVMLYSHSPMMWLIALVMGTMVSMTLHRVTRMGLPSFYAQAMAGAVATLVAAGAALLVMHSDWPIFDNLNPTLVIIGGIVLLVAGMMVVSAFQDAIDEYYVTAAAHLLRVAMMTGGIVLGVTIGLYFASRMGVTLAATPDRLSLADINYRYLGAAVLAASFALGNRTRLVGVIGAGIIGFMSLYIVLVLGGLGVGLIASSGIAAAFVGLSATFMLRLFRVPTIATINAGIIPLVPGLTLYSGLSYIAQASPNTAEFDQGVTLLLRALLIAVIVAAGATFGNLLGRPARRRLIRVQNRLPARRLSPRKTQ